MARFMKPNASNACGSSASSSSPSSIRRRVRRQLSMATRPASPKGGEALGGVGEPGLLPVDPVPVGGDQRGQHRRERLGGGLGQRLHVEDQPGELGEGGVLVGVGLGGRVWCGGLRGTGR